ncbi:MAG: M14 family zinc carboxypeptidase [Oscillospiraceae bacterium]|nr:M14 family zinc carboxypeptidase [Oscillospiraceae bacterium]
MDYTLEKISSFSTEALLSELRALDGKEGIRYRACGRSVCGRELGALEIGSMYRPSLFIGGTHGTEWASALCCLKLAAELAGLYSGRACEYGIDFRAAFERSGVVLLPLLNPDGYEIFKNGAQGARRKATFLSRFEYGDFRHWQANARGIDLNHNYGAGFYIAKRDVALAGIRRPGPTRYGGLFPFSQPETRAVRRLCARCRPRSLFALHSQGEEIYWRYGERTHPSARAVGETLAALASYRLEEPEPLASHAGCKDWFIKKYGLPAFTIELGRGSNPLPYEDFGAIWERTRRMLFAAAVI